VEQGKGEVIQGVGDAVVPSRGYVHAVAAVVEQGRTKVEGASAVVRPRVADVGGIVGDDKLAGGVDGVSPEINGEAVNALPCGDGTVEGARNEVVEGQLCEGEEFVPEISREVRMAAGEESDEVVLGGAHRPLSGVGAVVVGGNKLIPDVVVVEVGGNLEGAFVVENQLG